MKKGEMLNNMLVLATTAHSDQYDLSGLPYILHPLKVMYYLKSDDEELQCIALGHDLIEDTDTTYADLKNLGFTDRVVEGIRALTKIKGETHDEYKAKVKSNKDSIRVKMSDLRHNSDIRRLKGVTEKDVRRIERYHKFWLELKEMANNG